ncbi:prolyl oligopeptidase family serine peptidase [Limnoglobus roseus]|uniref:Alpha/beta hydrolase n=1 Tax=Limnoglobus roseus TaxID=2598579 RepID=A0A5C1AGU6_9BACT|nr:prolyl oligopeptidase family serine peptidase [Limnoglobus roseus]QEL18441.1 alpha/beta hydrolase [Limnoglobus roseus]
MSSRRPLLAALAAAVPLFALSLTKADGPADNKIENVRSVPPKGSAIAEEDLKELRSGLEQLKKEIDGLKGQELLPDVEIYYQAVHYAVDFNELYVTKDNTGKVTRNDVPTAKNQIKTGLKRAKELKDGKPSWTTATGLVVRGYRSKIDGSPQPYGLVIPKEYDYAGTNKHRLDFWWHGRFENTLELSFLAEHERSAGQFTPAGAIVVHPYGRFSNANKFAGEVDSLEILDHMKKHYRIDESRIVARGFSMGGAACWQYAVHYPTLFCAAAPGAGFAETREFLNDFQKEDVKPTWYEKKLWGMYDATDYAQNIFNLPTVAYSGEIDKQKQAADVMAREMKKVGLELTHIIGPKTGHSYEKNAKAEVIKKVDEIVAKGKDPLPKEIKFTTRTLRYNECAWLRIDGLEKHWEPATVIGKLEGNKFTLTTKNVSALTVTSPLVTAELHIDGELAVAYKSSASEAANREHPNRLRCEKTSGKWVGVHNESLALKKVHGLQGPIDDAFMDAFLMVKPTGTPMNEKIGKWVDGEMNHAVEQWRKQFRGDAPVKADKDITEDDIKNNNLVLWGDPKSNAILAKIADKLPIKEFGDSTVQLLIYPNPLNPKKYVVLNSGFTYREYDYLNNARQVPKLPDYAVVDVTTPPNSRWPGKVVRAGFFDEQWKLQADDGQGSK